MIDMPAVRQTSYIISILTNVQILGLLVSDTYYGNEDGGAGVSGIVAVVFGADLSLFKVTNLRCQPVARTQKFRKKFKNFELSLMGFFLNPKTFPLSFYKVFSEFGSNYFSVGN